MKNKTIIVVSKIMLIVLGIYALFFQLINFFLGTLVKSSLNRQSEWSFYINDFIPHLLTLIICLWFIIYQTKLLLRKK